MKFSQRIVKLAPSQIQNGNVLGQSFWNVYFEKIWDELLIHRGQEAPLRPSDFPQKSDAMSDALEPLKTYCSDIWDVFFTGTPLTNSLEVFEQQIQKVFFNINTWERWCRLFEFLEFSIELLENALSEGKEHEFQLDINEILRESKIGYQLIDGKFEEKKAIQQMHQDLFSFLMLKRTQNPNLRFLLRSINKDETLQKGYWFYGDDEAIYISFWNAWFQNPASENTPLLSISFAVKDDGACSFILRGGDKPEKNDILRKIASFLNLKQSVGLKGKEKGKLKPYWHKPLEGNDFIEHLEKFITVDKPLIDSLLSRWDKNSLLFPLITEEKFIVTLTNIKNWQEAAPKTLESIIQKAAKVTSLSIKNIKRFSNTYIDLNQSVICFYGKNGTGKTTLLRAIAVALAGATHVDAAHPAIKTFPKMIDGINRIYVSKAAIELAYKMEDFTEIEPSYNSLILTPRPLTHQLEIENQDQLNGEENPRTFNLTGEEKGSFKTLMIGFAQQNSNRIKNGNENAVILKPNLDDIAPLIYEVADSRFYEFISWVGHKLAPEKVRSLEQRTKNRTQINQIFEIISKITGDDIRLSEDALDATVVNTANPNGLPLELMSQGYQNVVGWVGFFMKRLWEYGQMELPDADFTKMPAICLIDEIDTYLHPDWQYRILSVLVDHFKNVQFIVTSHSPFVLSSIPKDKILLYELLDDGGEIVVRQETENLFGAEMNEMAREMGTTKRFKKIDEQVEKMFTLIRDNKLDDTDGAENAEMLLKDLNQEINPQTGDLIKANTLITTKKVLRQRKK